MRRTWPVLLMLLGFQGAMAESPTPPAADSDCPTAVRIPPRYPIELLRRNIGGVVLVSVAFDDCGRVVDSRVEKSSGQKKLDAAALVSAHASVLNTAEREGAVDGRVILPVKFGGIQNTTVAKPDWPKSHRRPRYLPDQAPMGFDSIQALYDAKPFREGTLLQTPYASTSFKSGLRVTTSFHADAHDPRTFWLAYFMIDPAEPKRAMRDYVVAVARYRLVTEDGQPVVRLGLLCERPAEQCADLSEFLLQGLPTAKPPNG